MSLKEKLEQIGLDSIQVAYNSDGDVQISEEDFMNLLKFAGTMVLAGRKEDVDENSVDIMGEFASTLQYALFESTRKEREKRKQQQRDEGVYYA